MAEEHPSGVFCAFVWEILRWRVVLAGLGQVIGYGIYFWTIWPHIRPVGSHLREAKGERF